MLVVVFFPQLFCVLLPVSVLFPDLVYVFVPVRVFLFLDIFRFDHVLSPFDISACVYNTVLVPVRSFPPAPVSVNAHVSLNLSLSVPILASLRTSLMLLLFSVIALAGVFVYVEKLLLLAMRSNIHT